MAHFELHPQLQKDTDVIGHFPLCVALLHKDSAVPWVILVPQRADLREYTICQWMSSSSF